MKNRKFWLPAAAVAAALVAIVLFVRRPGAQTPPPDASPTVALATVRYGDYAVTLNEGGHVGAPAGTTAKVAFAVPGILQSIDVRVGERVGAGTALASLDTQSLALDAQQANAEAAAAAAQYAGGSVPNAQIGAAQASARAADARVEADQQQVVREERLYRGGVAALKDVQAAEQQLAADRAAATVAAAGVRSAGSQPGVLAAQAEAARARAQAAQHTLAQGTLYAPSAGVVTAIFKHPGEAVDPTTPVLALGPAQQDVATLDVPGSDAQQIRAGNPVTLNVTGLAANARGRVTAVVPAVDPTTQSATVVVSGIPASAVAGSAVQARIVVRHVRGLLVPQSAIVQDPESGDNVIFVQQRQKDGTLKFVQRRITVRHEDGATAEIAGLHAGDRVAAEGAFSLLAPAGG